MGSSENTGETMTREEREELNAALVYACGKMEWEDAIGEATRLLDAGADPKAYDVGSGHTAIGLACEREDGLSVPLIGLLVSRGCPPGLEDMHDGATPLAYAAKANDLDAAKALLDMGARPDAVVPAGEDSWGALEDRRFSHPPLFLAARRGHAEMVDLLLERGAPIGETVRDSFSSHRDQGRTALHAAAEERRGAIVAKLLDAGADPNAKDARGRTPLHVCASELYDSEEDIPVLLDLVRAGADPRAKDDDGKTYADFCRGKMAATLEPLVRAVVEERELGAATGRSEGRSEGKARRL